MIIEGNVLNKSPQIKCGIVGLINLTINHPISGLDIDYDDIKFKISGSKESFLELLKVLYFADWVEKKKAKNPDDKVPKFKNDFLPESRRGHYSQARMTVQHCGAKTKKCYSENIECLTDKLKERNLSEKDLLNFIDFGKKPYKANQMSVLGAMEKNADGYEHHLSPNDFFLSRFSIVGSYLYLITVKKKNKTNWFKVVCFPDSLDLEKSVSAYYRSIDIENQNILIPEQSIVKTAKLISTILDIKAPTFYTPYISGYEFYVCGDKPGGYQIISSGKSNIGFLLRTDKDAILYDRIQNIKDVEIKTNLLKSIFRGENLANTLDFLISNIGVKKRDFNLTESFDMAQREVVYANL